MLRLIQSFAKIHLAVSIPAFLFSLEGFLNGEAESDVHENVRDHENG